MIESVGRWISSTVWTLSRGGAVVAALALAAIAASVVAEVITRGLLNRPFLDSVTIGGMGMGAIGLLGAAYALRMGKHVCIDLLVAHIPSRVGRFINVLGLLIALVFLVFVVWGTFSLARFSQAHNIVVQGFYVFPAYVPQLLVPVGLGLLTLELVIIIVGKIRGTVKGPAEEAHHSHLAVDVS